ncbi:MtrAB system accessory lipoprotein LpqB [Brevibacterium daeguense]|uniref:MtrAB system accessory lipoprotein LpqB n=1 Tax=Brevibacterium daeguense TaxID=909936 RepID=A0ABP8EMD5_9MICO|nr:LpqB family beta-propeller domain-containing protein [Brevibacterium daeguense]
MKPNSLLACGLALVLLLSGCVSIPRDGGIGRIDVGEDYGGVQSRVDPDGPVPGAGPDEIVRGFLAAGAGYSNNFEVARSFLTESFAGEWDPLASVRVMPAGTGLDEVTSEITSDSQNVSLAVPVQAVLDERRIYREPSDATHLDLDFSLRQVNGEWRISSAPAGMVVSATSFSSIFQSYPLYFYTPGYEYLVPDVRWFIRSPATPTEVMSELLLGPADHLGGAVVSAVPEGTQLNPRAVGVTEGTAEVGLSDTVEGLDSQTWSRLHTQVSETLTEIGAVTAVEISAPSGVVDPEASSPAKALVEIDSRPVVISDGRLARGSGTQIEPVPGSPELAAGASDPAVAIDESMYAYLGAEGAELHRLRGADMSDVSILTGDQLVGPSFDRYGWTWTAEAESEGMLQAVDSGGELARVDAPFADGRRIIALHVSRDGTRLGVLSADDEDQPRLDIIGITRNSSGAPTGTTAASPITVAAGFEQIVDFSWAGSGAVVLLGAPGDGAIQPYSAPVSGPVESLGTVDGGSRITAGNDLRSLRISTPSGEMHIYGAGNWQKVVDARAFDPAYPG